MSTLATTTWWTLEADVSALAPLVLGPVAGEAPIEPMAWLLGGWREREARPLGLRVDRLGRDDADLVDAPLPLASERLREAIDSAGVDEVQWQACELHDATGASDRRWWAMHAVARVRLGVRDGHDGPFTVPECACRIARAAELPTVLLIDAGVAQALADARVTGLRLLPTEAWHAW